MMRTRAAGAARDAASPRPEDLSLIAARAALSLDSAIASKPVDLEPIRALDQLLKADSVLDPGAKKALARLAQSPQSKPGRSRSTPAGRTNDSPVPNAIDRLSTLLNDDLTKANKTELASLRDFCVQISILARTPRLPSVLGLRT